MDVSENSRFSPQIIHFNRVFHYFHHPLWGFSPIFGNTHMIQLVSVTNLMIPVESEKLINQGKEPWKNVVKLIYLTPSNSQKNNNTQTHTTSEQDARFVGQNANLWFPAKGVCMFFFRNKACQPSLWVSTFLVSQPLTFYLYFLYKGEIECWHLYVVSNPHSKNVSQNEFIFPKQLGWKWRHSAWNHWVNITKNWCKPYKTRSRVHRTPPLARDTNI